MAAFQILDKAGQPIPINLLDEEAAAFWNIQVDKKCYAAPDQRSSNWFDVVGHHIAYFKEQYEPGWDDIANSIYRAFVGDPFTYQTSNESGEIYGNNKSAPVKVSGYFNVDKGFDYWLQVIKPYIDLINHWGEKGYKPKRIR